MVSKQLGNTGRRHSRDDGDSLNFRTVFIRYSKYWPLFLASLAITMFVAVMYYKYAKPAYEIMATLEIQDSSDKPADEKSSLVVFQELEKVNAPKVVENEIQVLKSNQLIKEVVDHFQLWASYKLKGGLMADQDLYGMSPVKLNLYNWPRPLPSQKFDIRILDANSYALLNDNTGNSKHNFGDTVANNTGTWSLTAGRGIKQYIGSTIRVSLSDPEATVLNYQNALVVGTEEKPATVIDISIKDPNVKKGEDFINYLIYFYKQGEIAEKNKITKSTLAFIDNRLDSLAGQLNHAENNIEGYRSGNGLTDMGAQSQMYLQEVQANQEKLNDLDIQLNIIKKLEDYVNSSDNSTNIPSTMGITDQRLVDLVQKLSDAQLERNKLLATTPEKNPEFEPIDKQISTLKLAIKEDLRNIKSSLGTTQQSLEAYKSNFQSSIRSVPVQERQLQGMSRQQSIKESLYNYLLQEREQISLSYASSSSNVRVVDAAHILPLKMSKKILPFGVALMLGLIFPAGFIYSKDLIKNTVNSRHEIETAVSVPVIAEFSRIDLSSEIVAENADDNDSFILIEQFRHLRTQLSFLNKPAGKASFTLVTSSVATEGKSFISSNLAVSLARAGKKTALLEMDVYKPKISREFNVHGALGLTEYLNGKAGKDEIIQKPAAYPNLHVISSGAFINNFSELLDQDLFHELLDDLAGAYDHVLFDTPPIHSINDAYIIAKFCDVSLYVVRHGFTSKSLLPFIQKLNAEEKLPKMHIVFNALADGRDGEGYKYENYYKNSQAKSQSNGFARKSFLPGRKIWNSMFF